MKSNFKCESSIVWTEDTPSSIFLLLQLYHLLGLSTTLRIISLNPRLLKELPNSKRYKFHYYTSIFTRRVFRKSWACTWTSCSCGTRPSCRPERSCWRKTWSSTTCRTITSLPEIKFEWYFHRIIKVFENVLRAIKSTNLIKI